jgi:hypothetical protein
MLMIAHSTKKEKIRQNSLFFTDIPMPFALSSISPATALYNFIFHSRNKKLFPTVEWGPCGELRLLSIPLASFSSSRKSQILSPLVLNPKLGARRTLHGKGDISSMARELAFYFLCVLNLLEYAFLQPDKKLSSKSSTSKDYGVQLSIKILLLSTSGETRKLYYSSLVIPTIRLF